MIKQKRYERILEILAEAHAVSIDEFVDRLGVSKATIRRDLIYLDQQKLLKRTHGGAVSLVKPASEDMPIALRQSRFHNEKMRIARAAAELIEEGMTIYLGSGTTMRELASLLDAYSQLTIVTNDVGVAHEIAQSTENGLIVAGGRLKPKTDTLVGPFSEQTLRDLRVNVAFMSCNAVNAAGFVDVNTDEVAIKRLMLQNAGKTIMLCDQSKFGQDAFMSICPLSGVDLTITNGELDPELEKVLLDGGLILQNV